MLQIGKQRFCADLTNLSPFVGRLALDLGLDDVQLGDPPQRFGRQGRRSCLMQVVELASRVRPAGDFQDTAVVEQRVEAGIGVGL